MFNFDQMMSQAQQVVEQTNSSESGGRFKYPLVYTAQGTLKVRLLFNPKSSNISRLISRHKIGESQIPCLRTYNMECPICKAIENVKAATGVDLKCRSITRGLSFAQYISSTFPVGSKDHPINPKDIVLLMYPWTVYTQVSQFITMVGQSPSALAEVFSKCSGPSYEISHDSDNKYTSQSNPYVPFQSAPTDEEFYKMLDELDNLNEMMLPATATPEVIKQVTDAAQAIEQEYLRVSASPTINTNPQYSMPQAMSNTQFNPMTANQVYTAQVPTDIANPMPNPIAAPPINPAVNVAPPATTAGSTPVANPTATAPSNVGLPQCYGHHKDNDLTCQVCPVEFQCDQCTAPF